MRKRGLLLLVAILGLFLAGPALAVDILPQGKATMETCLSHVLERFPGQVTIVEFLTSEGLPVYEFEVQMPDNTHWNVECSGETGYIIDFSQHVKADDPRFKSKAKISQAEAEKIALGFVPGKVDRREIYLEDDGRPLYEFDIEAKHGGEIKVEVYADTGIIDVVEVEYWEIGEFKNYNQ